MEAKDLERLLSPPPGLRRGQAILRFKEEEFKVPNILL